MPQNGADFPDDAFLGKILNPGQQIVAGKASGVGDGRKRLFGQRHIVLKDLRSFFFRPCECFHDGSYLSCLKNKIKARPPSS